MAIACYLAMTAAELEGGVPSGGKIAWMACHFSPYGTGLSNLPEALPPESVLMVNDRTPINGHDPRRILEELEQTVQRLACRGVLLDFQRRDQPQTGELTRFLVREAGFPLAVSRAYGEQLDCPVIVPPVPPDMPAKDYLAPWLGRQVWLELALAGEQLVLTPQGARRVPDCSPQEGGWEAQALHCHYRVEVAREEAAVSLWRTPGDLLGLLEEVQTLGVAAGIGLYQELGAFPGETESAPGGNLIQPEA